MSTKRNSPPLTPPPADSADRRQADRWVQTGFRWHNTAEASRAKSAYEQALSLHPDHPAALQLLGQLARRAGDPVLAERLMRQSLQADPSQAPVWNNLGNLLLSQLQHAAALEAYGESIAWRPGFAEAHYNQARALHASGDRVAAQQALQRAIGLTPASDANQQQLLAQIQADAGTLRLALVTLQQATTLHPHKAALWHNLGNVLQQLHRFADALVAHDRALAMGLDHADAHYNRGNSLQSLGRQTEAVQAYREALRCQPSHALALYDLARLRWRRGDADFDSELLSAAAADPRSAVATGLRAQLLWRAERFEDAAAAFKDCLARQPGHPQWLDGLGRCQVRLGQIEAGLQAHDEALKAAPDNAELHVNHARSLLLASGVQAAQGAQPQGLSHFAAAAEAAAGAALRLQPKHQEAWALRGLTWRLLGDPREAWLNDYARWVQVVDLPVPVGFASMADFNAALTTELRQLHHDQAPPVDQTLRRGTQTLGNLFEQGHPLVEVLKELIVSAVDTYIAALPADLEHPFLGRRLAADKGQQRWNFTDSWSSRLKQSGFHTNHVHPHGWLSSAYYVQVPPSVPSSHSTQGWLQFGQPDFDAGLIDPVRLRVPPAPGRLVLFPSMFWHGTVPFDADAERVTIAFDVVPAV